jgi:uncharacterized membrane protein YccC
MFASDRLGAVFAANASARRAFGQFSMRLVIGLVIGSGYLLLAPAAGPASPREPALMLVLGAALLCAGFLRRRRAQPPHPTR